MFSLFLCLMVCTDFEDDLTFFLKSFSHSSAILLLMAEILHRLACCVWESSGFSPYHPLNFKVGFAGRVAQDFSHSEIPMFHVLDHHNVKIEGVRGNKVLIQSGARFPPSTVPRVFSLPKNKGIPENSPLVPHVRKRKASSSCRSSVSGSSSRKSQVDQVACWSDSHGWERRLLGTHDEHLWFSNVTTNKMHVCFCDIVFVWLLFLHFFKCQRTCLMVVLIYIHTYIQYL